MLFNSNQRKVKSKILALLMTIFIMMSGFTTVFAEEIEGPNAIETVEAAADVNTEATVNATTEAVVKVTVESSDETDTQPLNQEVLSVYTASTVALTPGKNATELNFAWYTEVGYSSCMVQIAKKADMVDETFPADKAMSFTGTINNASANFSSNKVTVLGLEESTQYIYRLGNGEIWSSVYDYTTHNTGSYSFLAVGDPQIGTSGVEANTVGWINAMSKAYSAFPEVSFLLSAGDQVNTATNESEYIGFFAPEFLKSLPVATVQGNHDNSSNYTYHINNANESTTYGVTNAGGDSYFTYGDTLFIGLNSNNTSGASHATFMQEAIAANPNMKWKIVTFHHSIYSSASHSTESSIVSRRMDLFPVFDKLEIDMVIMGHDHCYTRSYQMLGDLPQKEQMVDANGAIVNPTGTLYITENSGSGSKYYDLKSVPEEYAAVRQQLMVPTFSNVSMTENSMTIATYRTDTMEQTDTYTIIKDDSIIVIPANAKTTTSTIQNGYDDMEERADGSLDHDSSDLELVWEGNNKDEQVIGIRFGELNVPEGSTIIEAYIQFNCDEPKKNYGTFNVNIFADDVVNSAPFENINFAVSTRTKTNQSINWTDVPEWKIEHEAGLAQKTPNLASLVQEIVNKEGWVKGNAMSFLLNGTGTRTAESFEGGGQSQAPTLYVTYVGPDPANAKVYTKDEVVIIDETQEVEYYFALSQLENLNALDLTFNFDSALLEFVKAEIPASEGAIISTTVDGNSLRVIAGLISPLTLNEYSDVVKLTFKIVGENVKKAEVTLHMDKAFTASKGVNEDSASNMEVKDAKVTILSYAGMSDINMDDKVSIADLSIALEFYRADSSDSNWPTASEADVNMDGIVDITDFTIIITNILK